MPKLGLGLSLPQTRIAGGFTPKKLSGLSLWLKADAGVTLATSGPYTYVSQIVITGSNTPNVNGTYNASSVPTFDFEGMPNPYFLIGPTYAIEWTNPTFYLDVSEIGAGASWTSSNGTSWTILESRPDTITISGSETPNVNGVYTNPDFGNVFYGPTTNVIEKFTNFELIDQATSTTYYTASSATGPWTIVDGTGAITSTSTSAPRGSITATKVVSSSAVTAWADQSGNGNNAIAPTGYNPTTSTIDGFTSVRFDTPGSYDGTYNMLQIAGAPLDQIVSFTSFFVATTENADAYANGNIFGLFGGDVERKLQLTSGYMLLNGGDYSGGVNPDIGENAYGDVPLTLFGVRPDINNGTAKTVTAFKQAWERDNGETIVEVDAGRYDYTGELNRGPLTSFTDITEGDAYIGSRGAAENLRGDICEIIIYNRALTDQEFENVVTYLNDKYAIY